MERDPLALAVINSTRARRSLKRKFSIFESPIIHSVCPQILHSTLFSNAPGSTTFSQEHLKTIIYAKLGSKTKCIMGDSKIVKRGTVNRIEKGLTVTRALKVAISRRCRALLN